ncbi:ODV-EC43 [Alphabaculovirus myunipunctae]|uniref:ODV-EC43 n=1 Tax=Mythimna unipuncta nucleopolyhedrovirus TaxID=447897 RepID=A0A2K9VSB6_9ABAC|nr:ODV-EC43 [Mythimna unipuncta nucleopolyhedrovirus]AUV65336.1 ODV-EC43 [Mythimna unipuncta nucleopolyhedrovirus]
MATACPFNICVNISDRFFAFPYNRVRPQKDLGGAFVRNIKVYVPTDEDINFVDKSFFANEFSSVIVQRQEWNDRVESRAPDKTAKYTIVYWNPIFPITEVGAGDTHVFSVLLSDFLFYCRAMVVDANTPVCPIQILSKSLRNYTAIGGESPLDKFEFMTNSENNNFLICFLRETPQRVRLMNVKRILTIFEYRKVPAVFAFDMSEEEMVQIYTELKKELVRRLIKGDTSDHCPYINVPNLNYVKRVQQLLLVPDSAQTIPNLVEMFMVLVLAYQIVPEIILKLNSLDSNRRVRLYCKNDSYAITNFGPVPNNMVEDNPVAFDYSDINTPYHLNKVRDKLYEATRVDNLIVSAARYNYFF